MELNKWERKFVDTTCGCGNATGIRIQSGEKNGSYNCYAVFMVNHWGNLIGRIPPEKKLIASRMFSVVGNPRRTGHLPLDLAVLGPEGHGEVSKGGLGGNDSQRHFRKTAVRLVGG